MLGHSLAVSQPLKLHASESVHVSLRLIILGFACDVQLRESPTTHSSMDNFLIQVMTDLYFEYPTVLDLQIGRRLSRES